MTQIAIFNGVLKGTDVNKWLADPRHKDYKIVDIKICNGGGNTVMVIYEK